MTTRSNPPAGAPCWVDLWTSDVDGSRRFYSGLFGWEPQEPNPEFGGYFMFTRGGVPIAGAMGDMGDRKATDTWSAYFACADLTGTIAAAERAGATVLSPATPVADLGVQAVLLDPTGANFGLWQPGTFPGFTALDEPGAPSWFELHTRDHGRAIDFYRTVLGVVTVPMGGEHQIAYTVLRSASGDSDLAGVMDASQFLPPGGGARWSVYWHVSDVAATLEKAASLGGTVVAGPDDTPFGVLATLRDPSGAEFKVRTPRT